MARDDAVDVLHRCNEPVPTLRKRFDETRTIGGVPEGFAKAVHRLVQPAVEVDKGVRRPDVPLQFLACDDLARAFEQEVNTWKGWAASLTRTPPFRSSPERRSTSNTPKEVMESESVVMPVAADCTAHGRARHRSRPATPSCKCLWLRPFSQGRKCHAASIARQAVRAQSRGETRQSMEV